MLLQYRQLHILATKLHSPRLEGDRVSSVVEPAGIARESPCFSVGRSGLPEEPIGTASNSVVSSVLQNH